MDKIEDSSQDVKNRKRKRGQRENLAGASDRFTSSFKQPMDRNLQASDGFKDISDQPKEDDVNNNNLGGSGETDTTSIEHGKLSSPNHRAISSLSLQSQQVFNHGKESEASSHADIPLQATKIKQTSNARSNDSDISVDQSDKESADYTDDYHDRDDYNEDSTISSLDNFNRQRQDKLAAQPRLKARKRQTRQQAMIDGQLRRNHEKNGDRFEFPDRIFNLEASLKNDSNNNPILRVAQNKIVQCDENNSPFDRLALFFKNYLSPSSASNSSTRQGQHKTRSPTNFSTSKRTTTFSGTTIHDEQSSDEQPSEMPTNRYQTFDSEDEFFQVASARRSSTRSKSRNSQRLATTNRYSKLSHHYNRPSNSNLKQSFFQE